MNTSRRTFLKTAGAVGAFNLIPAKVLWGATAPSNQLTRALIGFGAIARSANHLPFRGSRLIGVCDPFEYRVQQGLAEAEKHGWGKIKAYKNFMELLADKDVDIAHICTPSHWHGVQSVMAANAGKDIWCEKPMTRTVGEGKRVMEVVKAKGRMFRLNTWFRFKDTFYGLGTTVEPLKKLVDSGLLGWPLTVRISGATGFAWKFFWTGKENLVPQPIPAGFDYDFWLGPAPYKPYNRHRTHDTFRGYWDYDGGGLGEIGQHYIDPVQYILGKDDDFPIKVEIDAPQQHPDAIGIWKTITYTYADGCKIILEGEGFESQGKVPYIEGPLGKVYKGFECTIPNVQDIINELPDPKPQNTDWVDCVHNRRKFALNEDNGYHSATIVNMGICAHRLGRTLHFDPKTQLFVNDDAANQLIDQPMRGNWKI